MWEWAHRKLVVVVVVVCAKVLLLPLGGNGKLIFSFSFFVHSSLFPAFFSRLKFSSSFFRSFSLKSTFSLYEYRKAKGRQKVWEDIFRLKHRKAHTQKKLIYLEKIKKKSITKDQKREKKLFNSDANSKLLKMYAETFVELYLINDWRGEVKELFFWGQMKLSNINEISTTTQSLLSAKAIDFPPEWRAREVFQAINSILISQHSWYERKSRRFSFPSRESTSGALNVIAVNVRTEEKCDEILNIIQYVISVGNFDKVAVKKKVRKISVASSSEKPMRKVQKDSFFSLAFSSPLRRNFFTTERAAKVMTKFPATLLRRGKFFFAFSRHAQLNDD